MSCFLLWGSFLVGGGAQVCFHMQSTTTSCAHIYVDYSSVTSFYQLSKLESRGTDWLSFSSWKGNALFVDISNPGRLEMLTVCYLWSYLPSADPKKSSQTRHWLSTWKMGVFRGSIILHWTVLIYFGWGQTSSSILPLKNYLSWVCIQEIGASEVSSIHLLLNKYSFLTFYVL